MRNKNNKIRVLVLSHMYPNKTNPVNGIFIHNQTKYIHDAGCDVKVVSPVPYSPRVLWFKPKWRSYGEVPRFDNIDGVSISYPRYINLPGTWFRKISYWTTYLGIKKKITTLMNNFRPDVIHAHTATPSGYVGLLLSRKYNIPLICSLRGSDINVYPNYDNVTMRCTKTVLSKSDRLVSVSEALKAVAEGMSDTREKIDVIYNGCNLSNFTFNTKDRSAYRNKLNIQDENRVVIFVGELKKNKGIRELTTALKKILPGHPELHAIIVGDGPERSVIENEIDREQLTNKIHMIGNQPHDKIAKWLCAADIFVLPTYYEGLPNAVLEAMACSLPVIATNVGGIPEIIDDGKNGKLIEVRDEAALIKALEFLISNKEASKAMGAAGREKIERDFSWERNAQKMVALYHEIIKS